MPRRTRLCAHTRKSQPPNFQQHVLKAPRLNVQPLELPLHFNDSMITVHHSSITLVDVNRRDTMKKVNINVNLLVENTIQGVFPPTNKPVIYDHEDSNIARIATGDILRITINLEINNSASHGKSSLDYIVTMQIHESNIYELRLYEKTVDGFQLNHFYFPIMQHVRFISTAILLKLVTESLEMIPLLIFVAAVLFLVYDRLKFRHFALKGVQHQNPLPFFGHYLPVVLGRKAPGELYDCHYQKYKDLPYFGVYEYHRPVLVVNDLSLVEHILVKDFSSFANHPRWVIDEDSYLNLMTLNLRGNLWRATRYKLTASFTTSKMQSAFERILQKATPVFKEGEVEIQEKINSIAADIIASYFGATIQNKDAFAQAMHEQTHFTALRHLEIQFLEHFPKLAYWTGMKLFHERINKLMKETTRLLLSGCGSTSELRTILEDMKGEGVLKMKGKDFDINGNSGVEHVFEATDELLLGQAAQFLFAGLDATANTMGFLVYEMAVNADVQQKVREEAVAALKRNNGVWSYEVTQSLQYLQYCINESTRLHSVKPFLFREATRDYKFPGTDVQIKIGDKIVIPAISLQTDPRYYPEPLAFKPERWSQIDKEKKNYSWLPFGEGPRQCLGMRFAFMEMKFVVAKLLTEFEISISERTEMPAGHVILGIVGRLDRPVYIHLKKIGNQGNSL
ncbi:hypothetical protein GE061_009943 [Apolygus lucorum]|uniref:Cytochrome P450 n=1 Tax=Apolygus lucorum TaxID=248454 RepID=A0A8S9Y3Q4_APOLU|nr:hypothetical protein GE061_009943 [Apolygus lucorum]